MNEKEIEINRDEFLSSNEIIISKLDHKISTVKESLISKSKAFSYQDVISKFDDFEKKFSEQEKLFNCKLAE